jgi:type I phosphodiesterase/nucleotide pyrophosphatase
MAMDDHEQLEEKLRHLGYLNNPIDAFVVPERPGGSLLGRIAGIGARTALLVGPLLGALATVESAVLLPGLLHRPQDLVVFGLYQVCLYTAVFFGFGLLWAGAVALLFLLKPRPVGRPVLLRRGFELCGALFIFFYLSFWWTSRAGGLEGSTLAENVAATAVFAALSFWVGRYLGLSAYLVVMRLRPETPVPPLPRHSARFMIVAGASCVAVFALSLALSEGGGTRLSPQGAKLIVPIERRDTRLVLLGVDGLSSQLLDTVVASGRLPNLSRLVSAGARADIDVSRSSMVPPVVWTTLTTGILPRGHGVRDFDTRILYGVRQPLGSRGPALDLFEAIQNLLPEFRVVDRLPLSSAERQGKALWEVLAEAGVRSAGLNWWASWPAGVGPAMVVSDRLYTRLRLQDAKERRAATPEDETAPPELFARLERIPHCCTAAAPLEAMLSQGFGSRAKEAVTTAHESDHFMREAALILLREERPAFLALYLRALDVTLRATAEIPAGPLQRASALGSFADQELAELDGWIGQVRAELGEDATLALVGLPSALELEVDRRVSGVLALLGPDAGRLEARPAVLPQDVAPTLLWFYGLPLSEELAGRPVTELMAPGMLARYPIRRVASYGARQEALEGQQRSSYDERQIEMMRSLGYIQ